MSKPSFSDKLRLWAELAKIFKQAATKGNRRFLLGSVAVHLVVVILMGWSWHSTEAVKTYVIPNSLEARVLTQAEVDKLPYKQKQRAAEEAAKEKKRKEELNRKNEEKRKKELEKKRLEDAKRKQKEEAARKEAERQKVLAEKKKQQELEKQRLNKEAEQRAAEKRKLEEQKQRDKVLQEKKDLERLEQLAKQREEALREQRLAERLKGLQDLKAAPDAEPVFDADEKTRYLSIIRSRIERVWRAPPSAKGAFVVLRIELLPTGELANVRVIETSGSDALDRSALAAVRAVNKFEVPSESAFFEKYFRSFQMSFKPED